MTIMAFDVAFERNLSRFISSMCIFVWVLPEVLSVPHVPGCSVTDHLSSITGFDQHGVCPEVGKHLVKSN